MNRLSKDLSDMWQTRMLFNAYCMIFTQFVRWEYRPISTHIVGDGVTVNLSQAINFASPVDAPTLSYEVIHIPYAGHRYTMVL